MKRILHLPVALLIASCTTMQNYLEPDAPRLLGAHGTSPAADGVLRIVTFNVEHGERIERAIAGLGRHAFLKAADVLMLQEMDGPGVERIAKDLGLNYVYFPGSHDPKSGHDMGNAVLSPWPLEEPHKILLPHPSRFIHRARAVVCARVMIEDRPVRACSVHLGSPIGVGPGARREQAEAVLKDLAASPDPVVVAGDFNTHGLGERFMKEGYVWATQSIGKTVGPFSFDHVFLRGLSGQVEAGVAKEVNDASDHRPVWATVTPR